MAEKGLPGSVHSKSCLYGGFQLIFQNIKERLRSPGLRPAGTVRSLRQLAVVGIDRKIEKSFLRDVDQPPV